MLSHIPHALVYTGLCALPLLIWLPIWLWAEDAPHNDDPPDTGEDGRPLPAVA